MQLPAILSVRLLAVFDAAGEVMSPRWRHGAQGSVGHVKRLAPRRLRAGACAKLPARLVLGMVVRAVGRSWRSRIAIEGSGVHLCRS